MDNHLSRIPEQQAELTSRVDAAKGDVAALEVYLRGLRCSVPTAVRCSRVEDTRDGQPVTVCRDLAWTRHRGVFVVCVLDSTFAGHGNYNPLTDADAIIAQVLTPISACSLQQLNDTLPSLVQLPAAICGVLAERIRDIESAHAAVQALVDAVGATSEQDGNGSAS